jgi:hypothetical protein
VRLFSGNLPGLPEPARNIFTEVAGRAAGRPATVRPGAVCSRAEVVARQGDVRPGVTSGRGAGSPPVPSFVPVDPASWLVATVMKGAARRAEGRGRSMRRPGRVVPAARSAGRRSEVPVRRRRSRRPSSWGRLMFDVVVGRRGPAVRRAVRTKFPVEFPVEFPPPGAPFAVALSLAADEGSERRSAGVAAKREMGSPIGRELIRSGADLAAPHRAGREPRRHGEVNQR